MIAVYSLWNMGDESHCAGFNSVDDLMACMKLSIIYSRRYFERVILVTDSIGADRAGAYGLPCEVRVELDNLPYDKRFWAVGKLVALNSVASPPSPRGVYSLHEPIMHIDNDFIWCGDPTEAWGDADIFVQEQEDYATNYTGFYNNGLAFLKANYPDIYRYTTSCGFAFNCGVIGLRNPGILAMWWERIQELVNNKELVERFVATDHLHLNIIFEQSFLASMAVEKDLSYRYTPKPLFRHFLAWHKREAANMHFVKNRLEFEVKYNPLFVSSR